MAAGIRTSAGTRLPQIDLVRTLAVFGVVLLHFPSFNETLRSTQTGIDSLLVTVRDLLNECVFYLLALPALSFVSGLLAFRAIDDTNYAKLIRKKSISLVVPLFIWNLLPLLISLAAQSLELLSDVRFQLDKINTRFVVDALFGVSQNPVNYPLHFLRDLFVLFLLWPVWVLLLRSMPIIGLIVVCLIFMTNSDGQLIRRDTMAVTFYLGALFATDVLRTETLERHKQLAAITLSVIMLILIVTPIAGSVYDIGADMKKWTRAASPLLIWPLAGLMLNTAFGCAVARVSPYTFPIFLMHAPIIQLIYRLLPPSAISSGTRHTFSWIAATTTTVFICITFYMFMRSTFPRLTAVVFGANR